MAFAVRAKNLALAFGVVVASACALPSHAKEKQQHTAVTPAERLALIRRAQLWTPSDIAARDMRAGPPEGAFAPEATVACDFVEKDFAGDDPKFACAIDRQDVVKVRYGRRNGEVYAGVAATRLLWALGFGADALYPVQVICRNCPEDMQNDGMPTERSITFDVAAIERKHPGVDVVATGVGEGWAWPELDLVSAADGGAPLAQPDGLKLLAAILLHVDSKPVQQRLTCEGVNTSASLAGCAHPFMMIHDVGHTFAHARVLDDRRSDESLRNWTAAPVWKNAQRCIANVTPGRQGTLRDPMISEAGRAFLAGLLGQLSAKQVRDMFEVARFDRKAHAGDTLDGWAAAFERKRQQVASARCPSEG